MIEMGNCGYCDKSRILKNNSQKSKQTTTVSAAEKIITLCEGFAHYEGLEQGIHAFLSLPGVAGCRLRWKLLSNPGRWQQCEPNAGSTPYLAEWTQRLRSPNELPD